MSQSTMKHSENKTHESSGAKQFRSCKFTGAEHWWTPGTQGTATKTKFKAASAKLTDLEATSDDCGLG